MCVKFPNVHIISVSDMLGFVRNRKCSLRLYISPENNGSVERISCKNRPKIEKTAPYRSKIKLMLTVFSDNHDLVHYEFLLSGQTGNYEYYLRFKKKQLTWF